MITTVPDAVRANCRRGLAIVDAGKGGKGLRPATIQWARRLTDGEPFDTTRAIENRGVLRRFGPCTSAARSRLMRPDGPAAVSWLLRGCDPAVPWGYPDPGVRWTEEMAEEADAERAMGAARR